MDLIDELCEPRPISALIDAMFHRSSRLVPVLLVLAAIVVARVWSNGDSVRRSPSPEVPPDERLAVPPDVTSPAPVGWVFGRIVGYQGADKPLLPPTRSGPFP